MDLSFVARSEVLVVDQAAHHATISHVTPRRQRPHQAITPDALDDFDHGRVVGEGVDVHAHEAEVAGEDLAHAQAQLPQAPAALVRSHDDEGVSHPAAARIATEGQDEGGQQIAAVLVHDGEVEPAGDVGAELALIAVLVHPEALTTLSGVVDEAVRLCQLSVCHCVDDDARAVME